MSTSIPLLSQLPFWSALVGATAISGGVAKGFEWFDRGISPTSRVRLSKWLKSNSSKAEVDAWINVVSSLIDSVFGPRARSWKFFFRSCLCSLIVVVLLSIHFVIASGVFSKSSFQLVSTEIVLDLCFALIVNCIPDYFSVLISRWIVRSMAIRPTASRISILLIADSLITLAFAFAALAIGGAIYFDIYQLLHGAFPDFIYNAFESTRNVVSFMTDHDNSIFAQNIAIFFIASLFTSIWVWLYVLASVVIRVIHRVQFVWVKLIPILDIDMKPMQAIGRGC
jgi:hypothetical protein